MIMFIVFVFITSTIPPHKNCHKYVLLWLTDYGDDRDDHGNQDDHKDPQERELLWLADEDLDDDNG